MAKRVIPVKGFEGYADLIRNEDGSITSEILDQEGDLYDLNYHFDGGVEITTEGYTHINLTRNDLSWLRATIKRAEKDYRKNGVE